MWRDQKIVELALMFIVQPHKRFSAVYLGRQQLFSELHLRVGKDTSGAIIQITYFIEQLKYAKRKA